MRFERIVLHNFGSYAGNNVFDLNGDSPDKRIVIVGGKNGAGKTTLFTAIKVCLYGNIAFGFKAAGKFYLKEVHGLINSDALLDENNEAYVSIAFSENRIDTDEYVVTRYWRWSNNIITESFSVVKNENPLDPDELNDFQAFLIHLIPPSLLSLYFFDGERIADFFLDEHHNNVKDALLVLSGNDTYDILSNNIHKLVSEPSADHSNISKMYANQRASIRETEEQLRNLHDQINETIQEIEGLESGIRIENEEYSSRGGISLEEWKRLQSVLKEEEARRERLNQDLKGAAAEFLPFFLVKDILVQVREQIALEEKLQTYQALQSFILNDRFHKCLTAAMRKTTSQQTAKDAEIVSKAVVDYFRDKRLDKAEAILGLSRDDRDNALSIIKKVLEYDTERIKKIRRGIRFSIQQSKKAREQLQNSSIENYEDHIRTISELNASLSQNQNRLVSLQEMDAKARVQLEEIKRANEQTRRLLETELKKNSVSALADRVLLLVEELQHKEYQRLISAVETDINYKFRQLIRKENYVENIYLDDSFNLHITRLTSVELSTLRETIKRHGTTALQTTIGKSAIDSLLDQLNASEQSLLSAIDGYSEPNIILPMEVDAGRFSNGEKQILVMSLYWAIMNQSHNVLPFIIDTPFARIDTEHRANITEQFFKELPGQLIVLSTNEELKREHLKALESQIACVFLLEYGEDKKTSITRGDYF